MSLRTDREVNKFYGQSENDRKSNKWGLIMMIGILLIVIFIYSKYIVRRNENPSI